MPHVSILSPNADEALSLLAIPGPPTKVLIMRAAQELYTAAPEGKPGAVIVRSGDMGAFLYSPQYPGRWVPPCAREGREVKDVTGAGNAFLGGLAAGMELTGDVGEAMLYASVSAGFTIEQHGLPPMREEWEALAKRRLDALRLVMKQREASVAEDLRREIDVVAIE